MTEKFPIRIGMTKILLESMFAYLLAIPFFVDIQAHLLSESLKGM